MNQIHVNQVGRYQILEELGRGACGVVYRALDPAIGRTVAIKSIRFSEFADPAERQDLRERVLREAQAAGKLSHPNIVTIYDVLESNDLAHIFMEFVDGSSLKDAMRRAALPNREQMLSVFRQIAGALDYAHRKGIIHRDIKPANLMLSDRGTDREVAAKIADFGVAKLISHEATQQRGLMGTPSYMSPEQLEGVAVGGASDQFALAVVVYEVLTGEKPFVAEHLAALHYFICKRPAKPPGETNSTLNETVNRVMERALAKLPEERYGSCSEFIGVLSVALGECPDWQPVTPKKEEEPEKIAGNGWYAPETVVSSRMPEGPPEENEEQAEPKAIDPVVLPPSANVFDNSLSILQGGESGRRDYQGGARSQGTRIRVGIDPPAARHFGLTMAVCAAVVLVGILLLKFVSNPKASTQDQESKRIAAIAPPEDLGVSKQPVSPPADLTTEPSPVVPEVNSASTTLPVRVPAKPPEAGVVPARQPPQSLRPIRAASTPAAAVSDVELVSDPPGAHVVVDGRSDFACLAPCSLPLPAGRHTLSADLSGYGIARKIFNAPASSSVFVSMTRNVGMLMVTSYPVGTDVVVDGRNLGPTPVKIVLAAGRHHLSLSDGVRHHDETIQIDSDGVCARIFKW